MKKFLLFCLSALGVLTSCNREVIKPGPPGGGENILMYGPPPVEYKNAPQVDDNQQLQDKKQSDIKKDDQNEVPSDN